jgi:carboxyl-terminal processing protease
MATEHPVDGEQRQEAGAGDSQAPVCLDGHLAETHEAPADESAADGFELSDPEGQGTRKNRWRTRHLTRGEKPKRPLAWRIAFDYVLPVFVGLLLCGFVFAGGFYVAKKGWIDSLVYNESDEQNLTVRDLANRLDEVADILDSESLYSYDIDAVTASTLDDLLDSSGDAYAKYYSASEYTSALKVNAGEYTGLGVKLAEIDGYVMVYSVYDDSPAAEAGLRSGDIITAIDGDTHAWTLDEVTNALDREVGDSVELSWFSPSDESLDAIIDAYYGIDSDSSTTETTTSLDFVDVSAYEGDTYTAVIDYAEITIPNVTYELEDGNVGYITLSKFNAKATDEVTEAIESLTEQGATSWVLDLRDNPGGLVEQAVDIASLFIEDGTVMQIQYKDSVEVRTTTGDAITDLPLVVLVDGSSASASEIFSAAVKDNGRAELVGTQTYGKGVMQNTTKLSFGGAIKYTFASYLSPNGDAINGVGITPDIVVEDTRDDSSDTGSASDAQLETALAEAERLAVEGT